MAASATFALKSGEWFRRVRFVIFAPDSHAQPCALSGRDSTHRTDRNCGATSLAIVSIFERTPYDVSYFTTAQAQSDAIDAIAAAQQAGQPAGSAIYFTVDYNSAVPDLDAIRSYFQVVRCWLRLGSGYKLGIYAQGKVLTVLQNDIGVKPDFTWLTCYTFG